MRPDDGRALLARQWLAKARQDLLTAETVKSVSVLRGVAAFHCQQAVEKALKGFLSLHDRPFRRTHNLAELLQQCLEIDSAFGEFIEAAALLSPYVAVFRYPGLGEDPTADQTARSMEIAGAVLAFVGDHMPGDTSA